MNKDDCFNESCDILTNLRGSSMERFVRSAFERDWYGRFVSDFVDLA